MRIDEAMEIENNAPIILKDGSVGIVIRWDEENESIGVQVINEEDIRWVSVGNIKDMGENALIEKGDKSDLLDFFIDKIEQYNKGK